MNIINLDLKEQAEINKYLASCSKRKLAKNYYDIYHREIFPNIKKCHQMENITDSGINIFCDSMISHYFEYTYGNETYNIISRCSKENIQKFYDFCIEYCDSVRGWSESGAYIFYMLFQHIFQYMDNYINGRSKIRMMMIGGHDVTVAPLMDFLSGLNLIPRTHFPHFACNIVIELRKYGEDFYLEFYYNDILKYNKTLEIFKSILDNSKYSNLYNYCGLPSYLNITINNENTVYPK
jgi:L-rhamnose mutarotase